MRPVLQATHGGVVARFAVPLGGHHQGVTGHNRNGREGAAKQAAVVGAAKHTAVCTHQKLLVRVGLFGQASGLGDVGHGFSGLVQKDVFVIDRAKGCHIAGHRGHVDMVAVFEWQVGQVGQGLGAGVKLQRHAAGAFEGTQSLDL